MSQMYESSLFTRSNTRNHRRITLDSFDTATDHCVDGYSWITHIHGLVMRYDELIDS